MSPVFFVLLITPRRVGMKHWLINSMQGWCVPDQSVPDRKFLDVSPLEQSVPWILCPWQMCPGLPTLDRAPSASGA